MANYLCRNITELPAYMFANVRVPASMTNGLKAGEVVTAETLDNQIRGNLVNYVPAAIADITKEEWAIVLNGNFEEMSDGRRPEGNPNYTTYVYNPGEIATAVRAESNVRFEISEDSCNANVAAATIVPGDFLVPVNGATTLSYLSQTGATITAKKYLVIEATKFFRLGGQNGAQFAQTLVCRVKSL